MCASDDDNCRGSKSQCVRFMESRGEADWIMSKKRRKERREERETIRRKKIGREILCSNIKVRLELPRGGADITTRMSP